MSRRRVVITGLGAVTPTGNNVQEFWQGICAGKVGIGSITRFDAQGYKVKLAAEVKGFEPKKYMEPKQVRRMALFSQYAVAAAKEAFEDSGLDMKMLSGRELSLVPELEISVRWSFAMTESLRKDPAVRFL